MVFGSLPARQLWLCHGCDTTDFSFSIVIHCAVRFVGLFCVRVQLILSFYHHLLLYIVLYPFGLVRSVKARRNWRMNDSICCALCAYAICVPFDCARLGSTRLCYRLGSIRVGYKRYKLTFVRHSVVRSDECRPCCSIISCSFSCVREFAWPDQRYSATYFTSISNRSPIHDK